MNPEAQTGNVESEVKESKRESKHIIGGEGVVGYAVLGCLAAGTIAIYKAVWTSGIAAAACLVVSVVAFGTICHIYFRKD